MKPNPSSLTGAVRTVFAHRLTLQTDEGVMLADLTPPDAAKIKLVVGDQVTIEGERKPSELKVERIRRGDFLVTIEHPKKLGDHDAIDREGDPKAATASASAAGFEVFGKPRRKHERFEILVSKNGVFSELRVSLDGSVRHTKPSAPRTEHGAPRSSTRISDRSERGAP